MDSFSTCWNGVKNCIFTLIGLIQRIVIFLFNIACRIVIFLTNLTIEIISRASLAKERTSTSLNWFFKETVLGTWIKKSGSVIMEQTPLGNIIQWFTKKSEEASSWFYTDTWLGKKVKLSFSWINTIILGEKIQQNFSLIVTIFSKVW